LPGKNERFEILLLEKRKWQARNEIITAQPAFFFAFP
jgi:hypothetical protein